MTPAPSRRPPHPRATGGPAAANCHHPRNQPVPTTRVIRAARKAPRAARASLSRRRPLVTAFIGSRRPLEKTGASTGRAVAGRTPQSPDVHQTVEATGVLQAVEERLTEIAHRALLPSCARKTHCHPSRPTSPSHSGLSVLATLRPRQGYIVVPVSFVSLVSHLTGGFGVVLQGASAGG